MDMFRSRLLCRMAAAILLLTALTAQSQTIFACYLAGDKPQPVHYHHPPAVAGCEMDGGWDTPNGHATADCCEMSAAKLPSLQTAPLPASPHQRMTLLDGPQPPTGILSAVSIDIAFLRHLLAYPGRFSFPSWFPGTRTYLLTRRLRH